ncbi:MAG: hypothetical protein M3Z05_16145 [Gemmatimonadota bacterium]|nr:hypothetical protein [Gemmatimonadota bacterium]
MHSLAEIFKSRRFHPTIQVRLDAAQADSMSPDAPGCRARDTFRSWLRSVTLAAMDSQRPTALAYPTWSNLPRLVGDLNTPAGDNSQLFSPSTGYPAITVPMGFTLGETTCRRDYNCSAAPWSEATLIGLAYSYAQATHRRKAPCVGATTHDA